MSHCEVCVESWNLSTHKRVKCPFCEYSACTSCHEAYILSTAQDAHCMSCRKGWTREVLVNNFTQKFVTKTYKERRENLLLEREKSLMPETQIYVEYERKSRKLTEEIQELTTKLREQTEKIMELDRMNTAVLAVQYGLENNFEGILKRGDLRTIESIKMSGIQNEISLREWKKLQITGFITGATTINELEKRKFVRACPFNGCKGFLSTAWKCGICENWSCPECHEVKGKEKDIAHTCHPDNIATAQLMAKDTRNCPNCAAAIFKISGCDQMWCTQCHTAFSWRTGRIESHLTIHNPHYYEFQRRNGTLQRNPGDVPCGGLPHWGAIQRKLYGDTQSKTVQNTIVNAYRSHGHAQWAILPRYTVVVNRNENRDLRIKYMIGDMSDDEFKKKIQQREKANQRKRDIRQVVDMYLAVLVDLFQAYTAPLSSLDTLVESLNGLQEHYNSTLDNIHKCYKCVVPKIMDFNFV